MVKNTQWDTKTKIKTAIIIFAAVFAAIFYAGAGKEWISANMLLTQLAAVVAFTAYVVLTVKADAYSLKTPQGIYALIAVFWVLGIVVSNKYLAHEILWMLLYAPLMLICSQFAVLTPVAAAISVFVALKHDGVAVMCLPAVIGASLIYLSSSVKESALWKKLLFAVSELVIIGATVYSFWLRRYFLTVHSLVTDIWDSLGILFAVIFLIAIAVVSIKNKRSLGEIFGCVAAAGFAVVPMFMYYAYSLPASAAMLMVFPVICQKGLPAEELSTKAIKFICSKIKK